MRARDLTSDELAFVERLQAALPPILTRDQIEKRLGGVISGATLRNLDSLGEGPEEAWRAGTKVAYFTDKFLDWFVRTRGVSRLTTRVTL